MNKKYDNDEFIALYKQGKDDNYLAEYFNTTKSAIITKRSSLKLPSHNKYLRDTYIPTDEEYAIIIGTLLGDSTIRYVHNQCKYPNITFAHASRQEEYFQFLTQKLNNFKSSSKKYVNKSKCSKDGYKYVFTGMNMHCLVELREKFYPEGIKIIPMDIITKYFTDVSMYYLFMDDGSYDKSSNSYIINTQCFSIENLKEFINFLKDKFNLQFNIKKDHCLYLKHISNNIMHDILKSNNSLESMTYKYGESSLNSAKQGNS